MKQESPGFRHGECQSSTPLVLMTSEIETVLHSISDEELRRKIECVLTARVFKKR